MTTPRTILFDMDETLVDTGPLWRRAESELLALLGEAWTAERAARYKGRNVADVAAFIHEDAGAAGPVAASLTFFREALFRAFQAGPINPMPGAVACVRRLGALASLAVASGSPLTLIELAMNRLGVRDAFSCLISSESVPRGKPHPTSFSRQLRRLGLLPQCVWLLRIVWLATEERKRHVGHTSADVRDLCVTVRTQCSDTSDAYAAAPYWR